jgi:hypothetical protein
VACLLHRCDRQLPTGTRGTHPDRPGRVVLQRPRGGDHLRLVVLLGLGSPTSPGGNPDLPDGATAPAVAALRRLPPAR